MIGLERKCTLQAEGYKREQCKGPDVQVQFLLSHFLTQKREWRARASTCSFLTVGTVGGECVLSKGSNLGFNFHSRSIYFAIIMAYFLEKIAKTCCKYIFFLDYFCCHRSVQPVYNRSTQGK